MSIVPEYSLHLGQVIHDSKALLPLLAGLCCIGCERDPLDVPCPDLGPDDLVVTEIHGPQTGEDRYGEWIEVYNPTGRAVDLTGLRIEGPDGSMTEDLPSIQRWLNRILGLVGVAAASLIGAFMLFPFIGGGFMPESDNSAFSVTVETPEGSSLGYTRSKVDQIDGILRDMPGVDYTYATVGAGATGTVTDGSIYVKLVPTHDRELSQSELMVEARNRLQPLFGVRTAVLEASSVGGAQQPLAVNLRGPDVNELQRLADVVVGEMQQITGIVDVNSSQGQPRPEYRIDVNRDLANELGLSIGQIATTVRPLLAGQTATTWEDPTGEERDVVVQVDSTQRTSVENLAALPIATGIRDETGAARTVPLGQIAQIAQGQAPAQIDRSDLQRVATVSAGTTPQLSIAEASTAIQERLDVMGMPEGYSATLGGETEQLAETAGYVVEAILLAIILIFLILASQFESFTQPLAIMLSLPLSLIGVLLALLITDDTLMHEELEKFGIAHEWSVYDGDHVNRIGQRFNEVVLPFMAQHLDMGGE